MIHLLDKKNNRSNFEVILFIFIFIFQAINISAQDEIPDSLIRERIQSIQNELNHDKTNINRWWYGWLIGYSATTVGQGAEYFISRDIATRQNMALGASTTLLAAFEQLITPLDRDIKLITLLLSLILLWRNG